MVRGKKKIWLRVENTSSNILDINKDTAMIETFNLLIDEFLTPLEISTKRKVSISAVYKSIKKLMNKGLIKGGYKSNFIKGEYLEKSLSDNYLWRLHALSFSVRVLDSSPFYENLLKDRNRDELDHNTLLISKNNILIYLNKDFLGNDPNEYERKSEAYIYKYIVMLENNYKIVLKKGRQFVLKEFRCEIEKINDPHAKQKHLHKERLVICDLEDGKQRVITDKSQKKDNLELVKNGKSRGDARRIDVLWNDLLDSDVGLSELALVVEEQNNVINKLLFHNEQQQQLQNENLIIMKSLIKEIENIKK